MGLSKPSRTIKVEPLRREAPAPEPRRTEPTPEKVPAAPEREREKVGS